MMNTLGWVYGELQDFERFFHFERVAARQCNRK